MEKQLITRLEQPWSSSDVGSFLDIAKLNELIPVFGDMESSAKVRLLMAIQTAQQEQIYEHVTRERLATNTTITQSNQVGFPEHLLKEVLNLAENDDDEWVKVGAGLVRRMLFADTPSKDFLQESLKKTLDQVMEVVGTEGGGEILVDDWFSYDLAYMTHPKVPISRSSGTGHFTVVEEDKKYEASAKPTHTTPVRPSNTVRRPSSTLAAVALPPKPLTGSIGKRSLSDMGSEIRRQAESGRFKRNHSRISVIDIDEVKQIEAEKAQKAEERKQQARRGSATKSSASAEKEGESTVPPEATADETDFSQAAALAMQNADASNQQQVSNFMDYSGMVQYDEAYLQGEDHAAAAAIAAVASHARLPVFGEPYSFVDQQQQLQAHSNQAMAFPFDNNVMYQQQQQQQFSNTSEYTFPTSNTSTTSSSGYNMDQNNNNYWR